LAFCSESTVGTGDYNPKVHESQGRPNAPAHGKKADKMDVISTVKPLRPPEITFTLRVEDTA
jgi:hypothetical protein